MYKDANSRALNDLIIELKSYIGEEIPNQLFIGIALDITRVFDKEITSHVTEYKKSNNIKFSTPEKKQFRLYCLGIQPWALQMHPIPEKPEIPDLKIIEALTILKVGIERNRESVIGTFKSRINASLETNQEGDFGEFISSFEIDKNQLLILDCRGADGISVEAMKFNLYENYEKLANYHYAAVLLGKQSWSSIAELAIFAENMKSEKNFKLFQRTKSSKIDELLTFLQGNENLSGSMDYSSLVSDFYDGIAYGFQFQDLFISRQNDTRILIFQKIELDDQVIPCPDCNSTKVRGNSYPRILLRSFECHNPDCSSRSKIGRGKRFDYFSVKRNYLLKQNDPRNSIDDSLLKKYRKDIIENADDSLRMLVTFYSWADDSVVVVSSENGATAKTLHDRNLKFTKLRHPSQPMDLDYPLHRLLQSLEKTIRLSSSKPLNEITESNFSLLNGNSTNLVSHISEPISAAITSPPYYNAREYSQWPTLVCYLVDMMISSKSVFEGLKSGGYYFYNIGDIVGQDNVYVSSHMSNRRLMLGFYSILIFELVGFATLDNLIWDKGEVQSKRNSSENSFPSYVKPINCYEHFLVFGKDAPELEFESSVFFIDSVKKINSKGVNTYGHTAPYPLKLVEIPLNALDRNAGAVLDPFLGSGTTVIACSMHGFRSIGIEYDPIYFELAASRIALAESEMSSSLFGDSQTS